MASIIRVSFKRPLLLDTFDEEFIRKVFGRFSKIDIIQKNGKITEFHLEDENIKIVINEDEIIAFSPKLKSSEIEKEVKKIAKEILKNLNRTEKEIKKIEKSDIETITLKDRKLEDFFKKDFIDKIKEVFSSPHFYLLQIVDRKNALTVMFECKIKSKGKKKEKVLSITGDKELIEKLKKVL